MSALNIPNFNARVAVIGDVMLDRYWKGQSNRISPEAPVPVVRITNREDRAGGAANVALNISSLGAPCELIGIVGEDEASEKLESLVRKENIKPNFVFSKNHPTITKLRILCRNQQLLRLDFEDPLDDIPEDSFFKAFDKISEDTKILICSDYGKGSLGSIQTIIKKARERGMKILIDPKGTDFSRYSGATMLTPNMSEFEAVAGKVKNNQDLEEKALNIIHKFNLECLLITRSEDGMSLIRPNMPAVHLPTRAQEVYDVTGAGDTVIGVLGACLACGTELVESCEIANRAAGIVVGKLGTSTVNTQELAQVLKEDTLPETIDRGIVDEEKLLSIVKTLKARGLKIVMTNGCFDILHKGHVTYLQQAKKLGDILIVAVNSDRSVQALKGPTRPVVKEDGRMAVLAALGCVDYVVRFDEDTPRRLISKILPDVLVKGGDYKIKDIAGHVEVLANGGEVKTLQIVDGFSTTSIINRIKN